MRALAAIAVPFGLSGCAVRGAPSFILFGSYFPGWMFCALIGIAGAIVARIAMVASGLSEFLPLQLFICVALGVIAALAAWLFWFGQ